MITIYHNPRCSKSRQTLQLIQDKGIEPDIILYMENGLSEGAIKDLLAKLGFEDPRALMRRGEVVYKTLNLKNENAPAKLIAAMAQNPRLIERPIVVKEDNAILGRPPENVLPLIS